MNFGLEINSFNSKLFALNLANSDSPESAHSYFICLDFSILLICISIEI